MLSVIIPTLNASRTLPATLACLRGCDLPHEIIVVDGGSTDFTRVEADRAGATFLDAPRGRGTQLAAGAEAATGGWFLFLHADTVLEEGWSAMIAPIIADAGNARRAFHFRFAVDDDRAAARWLERLVHWRNRRLALPYGDQGLLINAAFYREIGGFRKLPLMEDVDLVRRIGRGRIAALPITALTSSARYEGWALAYRPAFNLLCLSLYFIGLPAAFLARLY